MSLKEPVYRANRWSILSTFLFLEGLFVVIPGLVIMAASVRHSGNLFSGFFIMAAVATGLAPIFAAIAHSHEKWLEKRSGEIMVENGMIRIFPGYETRISECRCPISECRWFHGGRSWATFPHYENMAHIEVGPKELLLVFPESCDIPETRSEPAKTLIVAVGRTKESRGEWEKIIAEHRIPCDMKRNSSLSPMSTGGMVLLVLGSIVGGAWGGGVLSVALKHRLNGFGCPAEIADGISFSIFLPGMFLLMLLCMFPVLWWNTRCEISPWRNSWAWVIGVSYVVIKLSVLYWLSDPPMSQKIAYIASTVVIGFISGLMIWGLYSRRE